MHASQQLLDALAVRAGRIIDQALAKLDAGGNVGWPQLYQAFQAGESGRIRFRRAQNARKSDTRRSGTIFGFDSGW
jgi:hypothetical protein